MDKIRIVNAWDLTNLVGPIAAPSNMNFFPLIINFILKFLKSHNMDPNLANHWILNTILHPPKDRSLKFA